MEGLGRFTALVLMLLILVWIPLEQKHERRLTMTEHMATEYLYEIDSLVKRRGMFTKEEFERYSYMLFLMRGESETGIQKVNTEIGRVEQE